MPVTITCLSLIHKKSFWQNIWQSLFLAGKCPAHQLIGNEVLDRAMLVNLVSWVSWAVIGSSTYISVSERLCFSIWACNVSYTPSHPVSICKKNSRKWTESKDDRWRYDSVAVPMCIFETVDSFNVFVHWLLYEMWWIPMTSQLTHETRLTSVALSTTSFPIIWCAGHLSAQNNDCHIFYQKLFLCINDGPVIVTGISLLYQRWAFYRDRHEQCRHPFPFHGMRSRLLLSNYAWLLRWMIPI